MNWRIKVKPKADLKVADVYEWYENKRKGLGEEFLDEWEDSLNYISPLPFNLPEKAQRIQA